MFNHALREIASMIAAIWIGLIIGVSFYAAPIKFTAEGVGLDALLLIGQVTFQNFTWVEFGVFGILLLTALSHLNKSAFICMGLLAVSLLVQKLVILPPLDVDLNNVVSGQPRPSGYLHILYGVLDLVKMSLLIIISLLLRTNEQPAEVTEVLAD
ncbi:hypothetical protein [Aliikangiella maris]|uniref:Uncharacterized protein n=2 Tax=Aliikangiella maris TaxID=3162458 RepID=A0ABV3MNW7_9GAMM